jgi:hypothetical protein
MAEGEFPVTADINGEKVVVGSAKLVLGPKDRYGETTVSVTLDLDSLEGSQIQEMITQGMANNLSIGPGGAHIINNEEKTDD